MWDRLQKILDRAGSRLSLIVNLNSALFIGGISLITGLLARGVAWLDEYGWLAWWFVLLVAALLATGILLLSATFIVKIREAEAIRTWGRAVDNVNPLDETYHKKRIRLADLKHPISNIVSDKRFTDCQIVGPGNILFLSDLTISHVAFVDCEFVVFKRKALIRTRNAVGLERSQILGGELINFVIFVHPDLMNSLKDMPGINFITLTGEPTIDNI